MNSDPFFETSHAKGKQDAAGANVKQKVSHAVLRKTAVMRILKTRKSILRRISPLQQPLHLHHDPKQWVSLVEYSFQFPQKVTRQ